MILIGFDIIIVVASFVTPPKGGAGGLMIAMLISISTIPYVHRNYILKERRQKNQCIRCGYPKPLASEVDGRKAVCPECGWPLNKDIEQ